MNDPLKKQVKSWLSFAFEDLSTAEEVIQSKTVVRRVVCYHAQQAAEKAIKAAFVFDGKKPPRTHDLSRLCKDLQPEWSAKTTDTDQLKKLSTWAVDSRYPGPWPQASAEEAIEAVATARAIVEAIAEDLKTRE